MKSTSFIILFFLYFFSFTEAQEKTGVGIMPFTYLSSEVNASDANSIQETVTNAFVKTKRFNIVDRTKMEALKEEKDLQKTEDFLDGKVIKQGISIGANFLISGHVIGAKIEEMAADDGKGNITLTYKCKLSISLKVIEVATGQVIASETIEPKAGSSWLGIIGIGDTSPQAAFTSAIEDIQDEVDDFVGRNFPISFSIAQILEKSGSGAATKILVAGGSAFGLKKGDKLKVVEITEVEINGKKLPRKKEIGQLKVSKVEDENFSICSVSDGGKEIEVRMSGNAKLQVVTKD